MSWWARNIYTKCGLNIFSVIDIRQTQATNLVSHVPDNRCACPFGLTCSPSQSIDISKA